METWSLPKTRPISCNDCPAFQRLHMSVRWFAESFTRLTCVMNTTFREKIYSRWCCIDRLSRHRLSGTGAVPNDRQRGLVISAAQFDNLWQFSSVNSVATNLPSQAALPPLVSSQPRRGERSLFEAL